MATLDGVLGDGAFGRVSAHADGVVSRMEIDIEDVQAVGGGRERVAAVAEIPLVSVVWRNRIGVEIDRTAQLNDSG